MSLYEEELKVIDKRWYGTFRDWKNSSKMDSNMRNIEQLMIQQI